MSDEKKECKDCKKKHENKDRCKGCACDQLRKLPTLTEVDLFLSGGTKFEDVVFVSFDKNTCCAFFNDSPEGEPGSVIIVDCQFIQAIRIEAD